MTDPALDISVTCPCCERTDMVTVRASKPRRGHCARCDYGSVPDWHQPYCLLDADDFGVFCLDGKQQAAAVAAVAALRQPGTWQPHLPGLEVP